MTRFFAREYTSKLFLAVVAITMVFFCMANQGLQALSEGGRS